MRRFDIPRVRRKARLGYGPYPRRRLSGCGARFHSLDPARHPPIRDGGSPFAQRESRQGPAPTCAFARAVLYSYSIF